MSVRAAAPDLGSAEPQGSATVIRNAPPDARVSELLQRVAARGERVAVAGHDDVLGGTKLVDAVRRVADSLDRRGVHTLATTTDNGAAWVVADLAALVAGVVHVPLPPFFTDAQRAHALESAGVDAVLGTSPVDGFACEPFTAAGTGVLLGRRHRAPVDLPAGTAKVTFTSGTTGTPKGVCLGADTMLRVAGSLAEALGPVDIGRHLVALPLSLLLENIAGVYASLWHGTTVVLPRLGDAGLSGSSRFDPGRLDARVREHRAHSVIVLPEMLRAWTAWRRDRGRSDDELRFVAVGGAATGEALIAAARAVGIPAYEGYGLSEQASVQTLNVPGADRPGSVGRPLPHARVRIAGDGEIVVAGTGMSGYLQSPASQTPASGLAEAIDRASQVDSAVRWWRTGDVGEFDADGFLYVRGRRRNVLITGFGRNVSPEWVESVLRSQPAIRQAVVFGEGRRSLCAVVWPGEDDCADARLEEAVELANRELPDYARVGRWLRARRPLSVEAGTATANGRPRREAILALHQDLVACDLPDSVLPFHQQLELETRRDRARLLAAPIIRETFAGRIELAGYLAFLREAYHHVRHTVPLLTAFRNRLPDRLAWMRPALDDYIEEETGHDEWILDDIRAAGGDALAAQGSLPGEATELMVAYAWDTVQRGNPAGFLGMVHVLEGTSVALALAAADRIQLALGLPDQAFTYLRSHGTLDREHTRHLAALLDALDDERDRFAVHHATRMFYRLYGDIFRALPLPAGATATP